MTGRKRSGVGSQFTAAAVDIGGRILAATSPLNALDWLVPREGYEVARGLAFGPDIAAGQ